MKTYDINEQLAQSKTAESLGTDIEIIQRMISKCAFVIPSNEIEDKAGIDYVAILEGGREVTIDVKSRPNPCSQWWKKDRLGRLIPEVAIETWSVMPRGTSEGKIGWTLDHKKKTDLILYRFHKDDTNVSMLVCFHTLRMAAERKADEWRRMFKTDIQINPRYHSEAIFVPANVVQDEMRRVMFAFKNTTEIPENAIYVQELLFT